MNENPVDPLDEEYLARICKALGHPARVRILSHLREMNRCVCGEIVEILPQAQSTVSQHLKILKEAGLIRGTIEGPRTCYCVDPVVMERFRRTVAFLCCGRPDDGRNPNEVGMVTDHVSTDG